MTSPDQSVRQRITDRLAKLSYDSRGYTAVELASEIGAGTRLVRQELYEMHDDGLVRRWKSSAGVWRWQRPR